MVTIEKAKQDSNYLGNKAAFDALSQMPSEVYVARKLGHQFKQIQFFDASKQEMIDLASENSNSIVDSTTTTTITTTTTTLSTTTLSTTSDTISTTTLETTTTN